MTAQEFVGNVFRKNIIMTQHRIRIQERCNKYSNKRLNYRVVYV